jgi:hypothetical protein
LSADAVKPLTPEHDAEKSVTRFSGDIMLYLLV